MRILLNSSILRAQKTGIGTYVTELVAALERLQTLQLTFFDGRELQANLGSAASTPQRRQSSLLRNMPGAYSLRRALEQRHFTRAIKQAKPDVYHDPTLWPLQFDGATVMTVHDLTHINFAHTQPKARVREIERQLPSALVRADRILVDSAFIAQELQQHYSVSPQKIVLAPLAHSKNFELRRETQLDGTLRRHGLQYKSYFLFVGTLEPRKNLPLALRAHAALPPSVRRHFPLVIAGGSGWLTHDIESELTKAAADGDVRKLGYIDHDDLTDLLAGARAFVFPSLYEGFGIPILEAMASGTPVLSSNAASLPEVGGEAARYFDPQDQPGLTRLMAELVEDATECRRLSAAGIERAKLFSWEKCAALTVNAYRAALAERSL